MVQTVPKARTLQGRPDTQDEAAVSSEEPYTQDEAAVAQTSISLPSVESGTQAKTTHTDHFAALFSSLAPIPGRNISVDKVVFTNGGWRLSFKEIEGKKFFAVKLMTMSLSSTILGSDRKETVAAVPLHVKRLLEAWPWPS